MDLKDKEGNLATIFAVRKFPEYTEDLIGLTKLKIELDKEWRKIQKFFTKLPNKRTRTMADILITEYRNLWDDLELNSIGTEDFLFTNVKFRKKRQERFEKAKEGASNLDLYFAQLNRLEELTEKLSTIKISAVAIHRVYKKLINKISIFERDREILEKKIKYCRHKKLKEVCPYYFRKIEAA